MSSKYVISAIALTGLAGARVSDAQQNASRASSAAKAASSASMPKAIDRANLDTTCAACSDFYTFANGGWLTHTTIPPQSGVWGTHSQLQDKNEGIVREIVEAAARDVHAGRAKAGTNRFKIGVFYSTCMDTSAIEALGTRPIEASMASIAAISSPAKLSAALMALDKTDGIAPFGAGATQDLQNADRMIARVGAGTLSLPEKKYYVSQDSSMQRIRDAFQTHVAAMFRLNGEGGADASAHAKTVLAVETKFAGASLDRVAMRDPNALFHVMTVAHFDSLTPHIRWESYLATMGAPPGLTEIDVSQPDFFKALDGFLTSIPLDDWKTWLRWRLLNASAGQSPKRFVDENFAFQRLFTGQKEQLPRWQKCQNNTDVVLGEAVGQEFVKRTFTPAAKARATAIVDNMVATLHEQIGTLDWMSDSTKTQALAKLDALTRKIGYPDTWRDYSKLDVRPGEYNDNFKRWRDWSAARDWATLGKPIDRSEWRMFPAEVDAYSNPRWNEIVFPAGILQPPFYDANADDAVNYGGIGATIGHEMSHGFDDEGRRFDAKGNLRDWWTKSDADKYNVQAQRVVDQFNAYTIVDSATHVNGKLTLGENIGDLGGLKIAYLALERAMKAHGRPPKIDGFTPEQRFFLGYAQVWRTLQSDAAAKAQVTSNPHAPPKWRVNGPLSNMPEFKAAWGCTDGDAMVRPDSLRARIW